jgi:hypothetical protein
MVNLATSTRRVILTPSSNDPCHAGEGSISVSSHRRCWKPRAIRVIVLAGVTYALLLAPLSFIASAEDDRLEPEFDRIATETATLRELPPLAEIDDVVITRAELETMLPSLIAEDLQPEEVKADARALAALGFIPEGLDLVDLDVKLLGEQAAGFYDPIKDEMFVISDNGDDLGAAEYFYSHEVVHALQDAYLDPHDLLEDLSGLNGDESLAALALFEGDAVAGSNEYLANHPGLALDLLREAQTDFPVLDGAPAAVAVTLIFPYSSGLEFVDRLRLEGGWNAVDAAYDDIPASTEQILHPAKYLQRDRPVTIDLPDASNVLGQDWRLVSEDTLGELQAAILLANLPPGEGVSMVTGSIALPEAARNAAAGWDGDRYALWEDPQTHQEVLIWRTAWDTPEDARAFSRALAKFEEERRNGIFNGETPDDIALITADVTARIRLNGQEVFYVQAPDLPLAHVAQAAMLSAPPPKPAPGPD